MRQIYLPKVYQNLATTFLHNMRRGALWLDMGLGKTVSTLTALVDLFFTGEISGPVLVIAPLRVAKTTWPQEVAKWEHLKDVVCIPILGSAAQREEVLRRYLKPEKRLQVFTINYDNLDWLVDKLGGKWPFATVISDESTKLKGYRTRQGTARARALGKVAWPLRAGGAQLVTRFWELTGTPSPNGLADLWGQVWFLDQGARLGRTFAAFEQRWFRKGYDGFSIKPLGHAQEEIQNRLKDLCLCLKAEDYFDLEKPIINPIYVDLPPKVMESYREMEDDMYTELENLSGEDHKVEAFGAAAVTLKCLQMANGAMYIGESNKEWAEVHDAKIEALREIVEEAAGKPLLVAYHFKSDLARLRAAFPKGRVLDTSTGVLADWNAGKVPLLFAHPASAGHGLNLQHGGNIIVFFGFWWDMEQHDQIIERIGPVRQLQAGFKRPVYIHHIIARNTIDEVVIERLSTKKDIQGLLQAAMKNNFTSV